MLTDWYVASLLTRKELATFNHDILLQNLNCNGLRTRINTWCQSYLSQIKQGVSILGFDIDQGTPCAPRLFPRTTFITSLYWESSSQGYSLQYYHFRCNQFTIVQDIYKNYIII